MTFSFVAALMTFGAICGIAGWAGFATWLADVVGQRTQSDILEVATMVGLAFGLPVAVVVGIAVGEAS